MRALIVLIALAAQAQPATTLPAPAATFGFEPGTDRKLADYAQIVRYFQALDAATDRVRLFEIGKTAEGREMILSVISSEANMARLDRYSEIARRLADSRGLTDDQARALAREGRTIVWLDMGLHATEVAHAQVSAEDRADDRGRGDRRAAPAAGKRHRPADAGHEPGRPRHRGEVVPLERRDAVRDQPAAGPVSEARRARQQPRLVHAEPAGNAQRHAAALSGVVPPDSLQPPPVRSDVAAHLGAADGRSGQPEHASAGEPRHLAAGGRHHAAAGTGREARGAGLFDVLQLVERRHALDALLPQRRRHSDGDGVRPIRDAGGDHRKAVGGAARQRRERDGALHVEPEPVEGRHVAPA